MNQLFKSLRRTPYQTLTAFSVLFFTLFLTLILFVSLSFLYGLLSHLETKPQVTVYFQTKTPENHIFKVRDDLVSSEKVASIKYINQKEAFKIYQELNKDNPLLLEMVSADILPPSLEVYAKKPMYLPEIAEYLKKQADIDEVQFQKDIFDSLLALTGTVRKTSLIFFGYLLVMSIIVLTTTTMFKVTLKKDEIELLRLLGASDFYIQKPYLAEGIFLGFAASFFSFVLLLAILLYFNPFLSSYLKGIPNLSISLVAYNMKIWPINPIFLAIVFVLAFLFGSTISVISSVIATKKYLKV